MIFTFKVLTFVFVLAAICAENIFSQQKLIVESGIENYSLGGYLSILEDKEHKFSINEAASDSMRDKYSYVNKTTLNLRFTTSAYWARFIVLDTTSFQFAVIKGFHDNSTWLLVNNEQVIEDIRLYYKDLNNEGNNYVEIKAGCMVPVKQKSIKISDFVAGFPIQKNVPDTVYLRVQTKSQFILSFNLVTTNEYVIRSSKRNFFHAVIFGISFLLILYNIILYLSIKEEVYIHYVLYILFFSLYLFVYQGYYSDIIGRTFSQDYFILPLGAATLGGVFWLLFTRAFLNTKLTMPWAYKALTYFTVLAPFFYICTFAFHIPWLAAILAASIISYYLLGILVCIISLKKGNYLSKYYLLAIFGVAAGVLITTSTRNNFFPLPFNFWTQNAINLGILWEALILGGTVGYRFNLLRVEKEKEKAIMRNQIAADLHDEIGSNLSAISLQSRLMMKNQNLDDDSKEQLQNIEYTAGITTEKIRDIVWFINPFHDKSEDLVLRMKELASKMLFRLNYSFDSAGDEARIFDLLPDLNMRRHIFLIFKETLNNVIKHSEATEVNILLTAKEKKFIMIIADNGKGFSEEKIVPGAGLSNLRNRAALIGAQILIESNGENGTQIILEVPLKD